MDIHNRGRSKSDAPKFEREDDSKVGRDSVGDNIDRLNDMMQSLMN